MHKIWWSLGSLLEPAIHSGVQKFSLFSASAWSRLTFCPILLSHQFPPSNFSLSFFFSFSFFPSSRSPFLTRNLILFHLINSNSHHLRSPSSPPPISLPIHSYLLPCTSSHSHLLPQTPALSLPSPSAIPPPPVPSAFPSTQFDFSLSSVPTPDREGVADYMSSL